VYFVGCIWLNLRWGRERIVSSHQTERERNELRRKTKRSERERERESGEQTELMRNNGGVCVSVGVVITVIDVAERH